MKKPEAKAVSISGLSIAPYRNWNILITAHITFTFKQSIALYRNWNSRHGKLFFFLPIECWLSIFSRHCWWLLLAKAAECPKLDFKNNALLLCFGIEWKTLKHVQGDWRNNAVMPNSFLHLPILCSHQSPVFDLCSLLFLSRISNLN